MQSKVQEVKMSSISQDEIVMAGGHDRGPVDGNAEYHPCWRFRLWTQTISTAFSTKVQKCSKTGNGDRQRGILLPPAED